MRDSQKEAARNTGMSAWKMGIPSGGTPEKK